MNGFGALPPEAIYRQLGALLASAPDIQVVDDRHRVPAATMTWLARGVALVDAIPGVTLDGTQLKIAIDSLIRTKGGNVPAQQIMAILMRVMAAAELAAPATAGGAFITAGAAFDAVATVSKICASIRSYTLLVDPYMDAAALTNFAVHVPEGKQISLLADEANVKASLIPAAEAWIKQYGSARPLHIRLAPKRSLHDRLIFVDGSAVWILTQSLAHFADRAPATIQQSDPETAKMKFEVYTSLWEDGRTATSSSATSSTP
jgi:hypothetical protein